MCVIMIVNKERPTEEMIKRAYDQNPDGVGAGWRDNGEVCWKKGVTTVEEAIDLCARTPVPYVVHFRVASVGGVKESLTHPFLISRDANLALEGRTKAGVLFHNGHWNNWNEKALEAAIHSNSRIPENDDWSDTRAMAWMIHIYGPGFMNLLPSQKGVIMTPRKSQVFTGNGWDKINNIWCSNDFFWKGRSHSYTSYGGRLCHVGKCTARAQVGKDLCEKCEKERTPATGNTAAETKPTTFEIATGGAKRPLAKALTLQEVETLHRSDSKAVSKSLLKKYKKLNSALGRGGNREIRAKVAMQELSNRIAEQLVHG